MERNFETVMIEQCAPVLASLKPAGLFRYETRDCADLARRVKNWNTQLNPKGLRVRVLKGCVLNHRYLVYVYRESKLAAVLADEKVQSFLILMVTIPMWINMLLRTYAWMNILSDNGLVNNLLKMLGISPITMMYTDFSVIVGLVCNFMPFMIIPIHTSLSKMDKSLIEAANDLGANPFQTFWRITWKLSMPGVVNGIMMVFLLSISTFVIPKLLGGGQYMLIGNLIESQFISVGDWNFGSAISLILAVIILIFMSLMKKMDKDE